MNATAYISCFGNIGGLLDRREVQAVFFGEQRHTLVDWLRSYGTYMPELVAGKAVEVAHMAFELWPALREPREVPHAAA